MMYNSYDEFAGGYDYPMYHTEPNPSHIEILSHTEQCVVCGDAADGFHYGVRSCRGCNAFFRRAVTYNMTFVCRRGGRCPVDKNARCACRACRLAKCNAVGMDRKAVQPKREVSSLMNGSGSFDQNDTEFDYRSNGIRTSPPNYELSDMTSPGSAFTPLNINLPDFTPALPLQPPPDASQIVKQVFDFSEQKRRRKAMLCHSLEEILAEDPTLRAPATTEDFTVIFQAQMVLMFEWVEKLPEFRLLCDHNDKTKLLKAFALKYMLLDNVYHTYELGYNDRLVLVNNNYIIPGFPMSFKQNEVLDENLMKEIMYGEKMEHIITDLVLPIRSRNLLFGEIMTMRRLMFWNPGNCQISDMARAVAAQASNSAMKELEIYLTAEGVADIEARMEFLVLLVPSFSIHQKTLYEIVRLIPSFGRMSDWNIFMDDMLKGL